MLKRLFKALVVVIMAVVLLAGSVSFGPFVHADEVETVVQSIEEESDETVEAIEAASETLDFTEEIPDEEVESEGTGEIDSEINDAESIEVSSLTEKVPEEISKETTDEQSASENKQTQDNPLESQEETYPENEQVEVISEVDQEIKQEHLAEELSEIKIRYVVNKVWSSIKETDIVRSCNSLEEKEIKCEYISGKDREQIVCDLAKAINQKQTKIEVELLLDREQNQISSLKPGEDLVNEVIAYGEEFWPMASLRTQFYGYSVVESTDLTDDKIITTIEYVFIYLQDLILEQAGEVMSVPQITGNHPLAIAAFVEQQKRVAEGTIEDYETYCDWCWPYLSGHRGWCGAFVGYCSEVAGCLEGANGILPPHPNSQPEETNSCGFPGGYISWYNNKTGRVEIYIRNGYTTSDTRTYYNLFDTVPQAGDIIIFDNTNDNTTLYDHVGIVMGYSETTGANVLAGNIYYNPDDPDEPGHTGYSTYIFSENDTSAFAIIALVRIDYTYGGRRLVSFNGNGGTVDLACKLARYQGKYGELPTPVRNGYGFDGWYTAASGGTKITATSTVSQNANHTLYAHWTVPYVTVKYYGYGEGDYQGFKGTVKYTAGHSDYLWSTSYATTGYYATGWNISGYSWGEVNLELGQPVEDWWIAEHHQETINLVQTFSPETVTVKYYGYGEGYYEGLKLTKTYSYNGSNQKHPTNSYATTGYYATGWNSSGNSWGTADFALGSAVTNEWIHSHAGQEIKVVQTYKAETVTIQYYGYGEGYYEGLKKTVTYTYGANNPNTLATSYATTGYKATGWNISGNSWGNADFGLGVQLGNSWIHSHAGQTVKVVQTYYPETVTIRYYGYGEGYADNSYHKGTVTYTYGASNQKFWTTSYASSGYRATGWNTSCNSWATPTYSLGASITNAWIHSHAGQTINVAQTFSSN